MAPGAELFAKDGALDAVNCLKQDGKLPSSTEIVANGSKISVTAPDKDISASVMQDILERAGLSLNTIDGEYAGYMPFSLESSTPAGLVFLHNMAVNSLEKGNSLGGGNRARAVVGEFARRADSLGNPENPPLEILVYKMLLDSMHLEAEGVNPPIGRANPEATVEEAGKTIPHKDAILDYLKRAFEDRTVLLKIFQEGVDGEAAMKIRRGFQATHRGVLPKTPVG